MDLFPFPDHWPCYMAKMFIIRTWPCMALLGSLVLQALDLLRRERQVLAHAVQWGAEPRTNVSLRGPKTRGPISGHFRCLLERHARWRRLNQHSESLSN